MAYLSQNVSISMLGFFHSFSPARGVAADQRTMSCYAKFHGYSQKAPDLPGENDEESDPYHQ